MQKPPIVIECPECGEKYLLSTEANNPSEKATLFADGYFIDIENWRTPAIIGCVTCELGFFPEKGEIIAEPDWDTYYSDWSHLKKAEPPQAGALAIELRIRKRMNREVEIKLRKELWYAGNHTETGRLLRGKNQAFNNYWNESLVALEKLIDLKSEEELILKAEVNRQLGDFDICISMLEGVEGNFANHIRENSKRKNQAVVNVGSPINK